MGMSLSLSESMPWCQAQLKPCWVALVSFQKTKQMKFTSGRYRKWWHNEHYINIQYSTNLVKGNQTNMVFSCLFLALMFYKRFVCTLHTKLVTQIARLRFQSSLFHHKSLWNFWWQPTFWIVSVKLKKTDIHKLL